MSQHPCEPVVLIPGHPLDRPDPEVGRRVRAAVKRSGSGPHPTAGKRPSTHDAEPPPDEAACG
jgi:hypothetical protein